MLFITGITGHTGRRFFETLERERYPNKLRCLVRPGSDVQFLRQSALDVELVVGDSGDTASLSKAMMGSDTVLHIAGILHSPSVIDAAINAGLSWAVLVHTTGRYSRYKSASSEYIAIEDSILARRSEIGITVLRPTMIYGSSMDRNMYKLIDYLYRNRFFPMFGKGTNLMQPVHARDLGGAYYAVLQERERTFNKEYNLPGKFALAYFDLVCTVSDALGRKTFVIKLPLWFSLAAAKLYNAVTPKALISAEQVLRMQENKAFDYKEATKDFGYSPIKFEEGIQEEVQEYLKRNVQR